MCSSGSKHLTQWSSHLSAESGKIRRQTNRAGAQLWGRARISARLDGLNAILYASLRSTRYLLYAIYLAMFVAANMAYTGHGFAWVWPDSVNWQQWSNPVLMVLYGVSGLLFAAQFLELRTHFPRIHKGVIGFSLTFVALLVAAMLMDSQKNALLVAFTYVFLFAGIMLFLGAISVYAGQKPARYFLLAAVSAMVGALVTNLAVWASFRITPGPFGPLKSAC